MSNPRQPLPPEIYQRRRAAALILILLIVVILLGIWFLFRGNATEGEAASSSVASSARTTPARTTPARTTPAPASSSVATPASATSSPASPASATPGKDSCALDDLIITASLDKPTYHAGEEPTMTLGVENPTAADCIINLDEDVMRFEVYDMGTYNLVWKDTDCFAPAEGGVKTFEAGKKVEFETTWSRLQSAPGQCVGLAAAPQGSYLLHTVIGDHPSEAQTFNLLDS